MAKGIKTEHSGGKNGGGMWNNREAAKRISKKARRADGKKQAAARD
jgi:hypothetical protein